MEQTTEYQEVKGNRNTKSTLFPKIFSSRKELIELFNAVNGTNYQDSDDFEINTIEGILYMTTKNDVSFLMESTMNLYEHQSTYNPNMPLRGLLYFGQLYHKYIKTRGLNIYSSKLQKIPVPHYVVFYNGIQDEPDEKILLLSDAFQKDDERKYVPGCLECEVRMLNINYGHNKELMEKCRKLEEYAIFVARLREYAKEYPSRLDMAITKAIDDCIAEGILKDFLTKRKSEVLEMVLYSFDKELYEKDLKQTAYEEGEKIGMQTGEQNKLISQVQKKLTKGQSAEKIAEELEENVETIQDIITKLQA
jgi:DNA-binding NarL/FixJ family response regulator